MATETLVSKKRQKPKTRQQTNENKELRLACKVNSAMKGRKPTKTRNKTQRDQKQQTTPKQTKNRQKRPSFKCIVKVHMCTCVLYPKAVMFHNVVKILVLYKVVYLFGGGSEENTLISI